MFRLLCVVFAFIPGCVSSSRPDTQCREYLSFPQEQQEYIITLALTLTKREAPLDEEASQCVLNQIGTLASLINQQCLDTGSFDSAEKAAVQHLVNECLFPETNNKEASL